MINLITGYNNTGKTTWIEEKVYEKIWEYLRTFEDFGQDDEEDSEEAVRLFRYECTVGKLYYDSLGYNQTLPLPVYFNYPENGLHPSLQSKLVEEFIKLHNEGYDVYIETHSDHIINATRVAIKQGLIKPEDVKVLFFKAIDDIVEVKINEKGDWRKAPIGFCDEYDKQLSLLFL
jgi:hypothetical protein